jgi:hypothetical protein
MAQPPLGRIDIDRARAHLFQQRAQMILIHTLPV